MTLDKEAIYKYKMGIDDMARTDIKARIEKTQRRLGVAEFIDAILIPRISDALDRIYALRMYVDDCEDANRRSGLPNNYTAISDHLSCIEDVVRYTYDDGRRYVDGTTTGIEDMAFPEPVEESSVTSLQDILAYVQAAPAKETEPNEVAGTDKHVTANTPLSKVTPDSKEYPPVDLSMGQIDRAVRTMTISGVVNSMLSSTINHSQEGRGVDKEPEIGMPEPGKTEPDKVDGEADTLKELQTENKLLRRAIRWFVGGGHGISSIAILLHMLDIMHGSQMFIVPNNVTHPTDGSDFDRCLALLKHFPEFEKRLPEMAHLSRAWDVIISHWEEIKKTPNAERTSVITNLLLFDEHPASMAST